MMKRESHLNTHLEIFIVITKLRKISNWKRKQATFKGIKFMLWSKLEFAKQNTEGIKAILYNTVWMRMFLRNMNFMLVHGVFHLLSSQDMHVPSFRRKKKKKWKYNTTYKDNKQRKSKKENKFRLKLKKIGKTTRPFRYDLNWIPYDYTVEVTNRCKELYLIDRVPDELWMDVHDFVQETGIQTIPKKKKCKKAKWQEEKWKAKEKKKDTHLSAEFQKLAWRDKKAFLSDQCKEIKENNRIGKTRDLFKKVRDTKGTFHAKMGTIKDRSCMDLIEAVDIKKNTQKNCIKNNLHDPGNHDGVITNLEADILECEVK